MTTLVQHKLGETALNQATVAITVSSTGAGNLGVVGAGNTGTLTVSGVADNAAGGSSIYTQVPGATFNGTANDKGDVWACTSLKAGATTVTITYSAADTSIKDGWFYEVSGLTSPVTDGINALSAQTGAGDSSDTGAPVTTTATDGFIFALIITSNSITQNTKTGNEFTSGGDIQPTTGNAVCTLISTTAVTHTPVWLDNAAGATFGAATVAFKAGGTGFPGLLSVPVTLGLG